VVKASPLLVALEDARSLVDDLGAEVAADYGDPPAEERALRESAGMVDRSAGGAVVVSGPDTITFLHSLLSQDVTGLEVGQGVHALLLSPQGKLDTDLRVLRTGVEECRLDCEVGRGEALAASLRRFKIRVKAEVDDVSEDWGCICVRGPQSDVIVEQAAATPVPPELHSFVAWPALAGVLIVRAGWPGGLTGVDVVGPVDGLAAAWVGLEGAGAIPAGLSAYEAVRVTAGVPRQGRDIDEKTIPQEAFLERDAVSFTKGCFLGQELVCRIDTRGHVNKYLRRLNLSGGIDTTPPPGAGIVVGDKEVGTLTTVARSGTSIVALGYLRREVEVPVEVSLRWDGHETPASAAALPERP
jgi:tRNA-modifying protein YgfZ